VDTSSLSGKTISQVAIGDEATIVLTSTNELFGWGCKLFNW
jgi:alpha-tubulin suppressor-like RCC1 family protein